MDRVVAADADVVTLEERSSDSQPLHSTLDPDRNLWRETGLVIEAGCRPESEKDDSCGTIHTVEI